MRIRSFLVEHGPELTLLPRTCLVILPQTAESEQFFREVFLETLESDHLNAEGRPKIPQRETSRQRRQQRSLFPQPEDPLLNELRRLEVDQLSPMQALTELYRLRQQLTQRD